jgi:hypothetical protein
MVATKALTENSLRMIVNKELLDKVREVQKSLPHKLSDAIAEKIERYETACHLSCGKDPQRSAYWERQAGEARRSLMRHLPEEAPLGASAEELAS